MPKHQQANIISSEEINRKALERTLQRTVTLLKGTLIFHFFNQI